MQCRLFTIPIANFIKDDTCAHAEIKPVVSLTRREAHVSCLLATIATCIVYSVLFLLFLLYLLSISCEL